jgi:hypothetical protein
MDNPRNTSANTPGYETRDANTAGVFNFLVILGVVLVATALICWGLFRFFTAHEVEAPATESPFADTRQLPLGPQLQVNPRQDWLNFRADQEKSLETLDWANRSAGTARVPIEDAMELLVKKGVPVQGEAAQAETSAPKIAPGKAKKP